MHVRGTVESLRLKGKKITPTRLEIIKQFSGEHKILSASDILNLLSIKNISVNKTTVYRELAFLVKNKIVREVSVANRTMHYESALLPHHHHAICRACGDTVNVMAEDLEALVDKALRKIKKTGFVVSDHSLEFFGKCVNCK
ncbi:transcriptional repressor [Candidatus Microgenomates bacterium]|nr:MAG: transcriptional repressor [Candidatus Microgenomates bacterium]